MEGEMSFLKDSDFEDPTDASWAPFNKKTLVHWSTGPDPNALTGSKIGSIQTDSPGGSIAQDVKISAEHVSAFAFVRSVTGTPIRGVLAIWNLNAPLIVADCKHRRSGSQSSHRPAHIDCNWPGPSDP